MIDRAASGRRPPGARAEAVRILADVEAGGWSDRLLQSREERLLEDRERRFLHLLVLTTLRWQGALDLRLDPLVKGGLARLQPLVRAALRVGLCEAALLGRIPAVAADAAVESLKTVAGGGAAGLVNAVLRRLFAAPDLALDETATAPDWLVARWTRAWGAERTRALIAAMNRPGRPFAVARPDRGGREALAAGLARRGVLTKSASRCPWGLVVERGAPQRTPEFAAGDFLLMDEGAALVGLLGAPDQPGPVVDLAAAPGAKAALLAHVAGRPVVAVEVHGERSRRLSGALAQRAPAGAVVTLRADSTQPPLRPGVFSVVLLDAPCSGTGTLRRRPEKRHRLRPDDIAACAGRQAALLDSAATLVAPGGSLLYAVCSLEPEEGRRQVERLLAARPDFVAEDPRRWLGVAAEGLVQGDPPLLETTPDREDLDGFVAARLVRRG